MWEDPFDSMPPKINILYLKIQTIHCHEVSSSWHGNLKMFGMVIDNHETHKLRLECQGIQRIWVLMMRSQIPQGDNLCDVMKQRQLSQDAMLNHRYSNKSVLNLT